MPPRVREVIYRMARVHHVTIDDVLGHCGRRKLIAARRACWVELQGLIKPNGQPMSTVQIGRWFGVRHTTVLRGIRAFEEGRLPWSPMQKAIGSRGQSPQL